MNNQYIRLFSGGPNATEGSLRISAGPIIGPVEIYWERCKIMLYAPGCPNAGVDLPLCAATVEYCGFFYEDFGISIEGDDFLERARERGREIHDFETFRRNVDAALIAPVAPITSESVARATADALIPWSITPSAGMIVDELGGIPAPRNVITSDIVDYAVPSCPSLQRRPGIFTSRTVPIDPDLLSGMHTSDAVPRSTYEPRIAPIPLP